MKFNDIIIKGANMEENKKKQIINRIFIALTICLALVIVFLALFLLLDFWTSTSDYFLLIIGLLVISIGVVSFRNRRVISIIYLVSGLLIIIGFIVALTINPSFIIR